MGDPWYLDEVFIKNNSELIYLWRAVDQDGDTIDILVQNAVTSGQKPSIGLEIWITLS